MIQEYLNLGRLIPYIKEMIQLHQGEVMNNITAHEIKCQGEYWYIAISY